VAEFAVELFHLQRAGRDLVKLFGVGTIGAFDGAVEFGRTWRQDEQMEAALLAGLLELGSKLGTAVNLQGADGKRHAELQGVEELSGGLGGGAGVRLQHVPAGNHVASGELFKDHAGNGTDVQGIDFDQVAGLGDRVFPGFAHRERTGAQRAARSRDSSAWRFHEPALQLQASENASHHGSRNRQLLAAQQNRQLVFAPTRKLQPQSQNLFF